LKVAYFVGNYHRFTGSQRSLWLLLRGMDRTRVDPLLVFPGDGYATSAFRELGLPLVVEAPAGAAQEFGGGLVRAGLARRALVAATTLAPYTLRLARLLRREAVDLLHTNDPRGQLLSAPAARLAGVPVVYHVRGNQRVLGPLYLNACALLADRMVFVADAIREAFPRRYAAKFRTVYNGIDLPDGTGTRGRPDLLPALPPDAVVFAMVGSLAPFKGAHHALAALRRLADPRIHLVFVGDRPDEAYGRALDEHTRGLAAHFVGWDPNPADWFRAADAVLLPTIEREEIVIDGARRTVVGTEGFSRTVLEAMSHRRPVIATRVAGAAEQIVDGESGLLVPPSDPVALAAAMARLAGDPPLRSRLGAAAERRVRERFSIAQAVAGTIAVYDELAVR